MLDVIMNPAVNGFDLILVIGALSFAVRNYIKEGKPNDQL